MRKAYGRKLVSSTIGIVIVVGYSAGMAGELFAQRPDSVPVKIVDSVPIPVAGALNIVAPSPVVIEFFARQASTSVDA